LRERVEDISLLFNKFIWAAKRECQRIDPANFDYANVRKIDVKGLHVLTRLPWRDNTRELKRFADDIMSSRIERKIVSDEISFDEIIRCVIRNEKKLLGK
jgi:DNA-binding NtrC family response regulator